MIPSALRVPSSEEDIPAVTWANSTAADGAEYARLELRTPAGIVPAVPLGFYTDLRALAVLLPAEMAPWAPAGLFRLADVETGADSEDGQCAAAVPMVVDYISCTVLHAYAGSGVALTWSPDGRWPAGLHAANVELEPSTFSGQQTSTKMACLWIAGP